MLLRLVFRILLGPAPVEPTPLAEIAEAQARDEMFDAGNYAVENYPTLRDLYEWDVEAREERIALGVRFCLQWRFATWKVPFLRRPGSYVNSLPVQPFNRFNPYRNGDRVWAGQRQLAAQRRAEAR